MIPALLIIGWAGAVALVLACLTDNRTTAMARTQTTAARKLPSTPLRAAVHHSMGRHRR